MTMALKTIRRRTCLIGAWLITMSSVAIAAPNVQVYIEDSPAAQDLLLEARQLHAQGRLAQAVAVYQRIIDEYPSKLMPTEPGLYVGAALRVRQEIAGHSQLLESYRRLQQPAAVGMRAGHDQGNPGADPGEPADIDLLSSILQRYALTTGGLEAGLDLAALFLERARINDAAVVLDLLADHPDLPNYAERWHLLQSAAGLYAKGDQRLQRHRTALTDADRLKLLDQWIATLQSPGVALSSNSPGPLSAQEWPNISDEPMWSIKTASHQRSTIENLRPGMGGRPNQWAQSRVANQLSIMPQVVGDQLYLNDAVSVIALDRLSGRAMWIYHSADLKHSVNLSRINPRMGVSSYVASQSVAVNGDIVAAVVGHASPMRRLIPGVYQHTKLVCLSGTDGKLQWRLSPGEIDETLANGYFHGTPIVRDRSVFVLLSRGQLQGFHSAYIAAVDVRTGKLLWQRHLLSSAIGRGQAVQTYARMIYHEGKLFVVDHHGPGAAACLNARNGEMTWLTLAEDSTELKQLAHQRASRRPFTVSNTAPDVPVLCRAGLIVRYGGSAALIDPATGQRIRELDDSAWTNAQYMIRSPAGVITVGKHVRHFDGSTLELLWTRQLSADDRRDPRGRPVVTQSHIVLPLVKQLLVLNLDDGMPAKRVPMASTGSVVVLDDQLVTTSATSVNIYMSWELAKQSLQQRIKNKPDHPRAALNLAHLALMTSHHAALLDAVDQAVAAAGDDDQAQQRVFRYIRALVDPQGSADVPLIDQWQDELEALDEPMRRQLFDRMIAAAHLPAQVVAYHLAFGQFLEDRGEHILAVAQYQAILIDMTLASQDVAFGTGSRQAGLEATLRLTTIVRKSGPQVYRAFDAQARQRLAELRASGAVQISALINLARAYPMSAVAPHARADAAELLVTAGRITQAVIQLRRAAGGISGGIPGGVSGGAQEDALKARVIGRLVEIYEGQNQPGRALRLLERTYREQPNLRPLRDGEPADITQWIAHLATQSRQGNHLPQIRLPLGKPRSIQGRLLTPTAQARRAWPDDICLIHIKHQDRDAVQLLTGQLLKPAWTTAVPSNDMQLVSLSSEQALLWSPKSTTLLSIETPTGRVAWRVDNLADQISQISGDPLNAQLRRFRRSLNPNVARVRRGQDRFIVGDNQIVMPGRGQQFPANQAVTPGYVIVAGELVVCIGDYSGRFIALDHHTGQVLWRERLEIEHLRHVALSDQILAVAGSTLLPDNRNSVAGHVILLDPLTGQKKLPLIYASAEIQWIDVSQSGTFLYATADTLFSRSVEDGELVWRHKIGEQGVFWNAMITDTHVLIAAATGSLTLLDIEQGQTLGRIVRPGPNINPQTVQQRRMQMRAADVPINFAAGAHVQAAGDQWHMLNPHNAETRSTTGQLIWRDAIAADVKNLIFQYIGEKNIAILNNHSTAAGLAYQLYMLDRSGGAILDQCDLPVNGKPYNAHKAVMLDQAMVLTDNQSVIIVPGTGSP